MAITPFSTMRAEPIHFGGAYRALPNLTSGDWGPEVPTMEIGYHADAINNNPSRIFSPHIIAGFIPVYESGVNDLLNLYQNGKNIYSLPNLGRDLILWRKSFNDQSWNANEVQGVDYATMLFGLATLPQFLGPDFFAAYNDFFNNPCGITTRLKNAHFNRTVKVFPNPAARQLQGCIRKWISWPR